MYVNKNFCSVAEIKQLLRQLVAVYQGCKTELAALSNPSAVMHLTITLQRTSFLIQRYSSVLIELQTAESRYQRLCKTITAAMTAYERNNQSPAEQRSISIKMITDCIKQLACSKMTAEEKYSFLAAFIAKQLTAVECDHNKNFWSNLFTHSNLATAYCDVLRYNCINPCTGRLEWGNDSPQNEIKQQNVL